VSVRGPHGVGIPTPCGSARAPARQSRGRRSGCLRQAPRERIASATCRHPEALARLGAVRLRHVGDVAGVTFARDAKGIFSADRDGRAVPWDSRMGREVGVYSRWSQPKAGDRLSPVPRAIARRPDARRLLLQPGGRHPGLDAPCLAFRVDIGKEAGRLKSFHGEVLLLAFTHDDKRFVSRGQRTPIACATCHSNESR
jgi:hypothetical protein